MRAVIVDDENHALNRLSLFLSEHADVEIAARCTNGEDAIDAVDRHKPDVAFIDVEMPEMDGFELASAIASPGGPQIVFVTAFDEYAIRAFDNQAIDYLLKPVERPRLAESLKRVRRRISRDQTLQQIDELENLIEDLRHERSGSPGAARYRDFWVKDSGRVVKVAQKDIHWIEADRDYLHLHLAKRQLMMRETMNHMMERLHPGMFIRIHRSTIVNTEQIAGFETGRNGLLSAVLHDGTKLSVGQTYRSQISAQMLSA